MKYMFDTNICIYIIKKKPVSVITHLQKQKIEDICISSITLAELEYGIAKSKSQQQNKIALLQFIAPIIVLPFADSAATQYGLIRAKLENSGKIIGPLDMLIASHALSEKLILVTNNIKEFERIDNLQLENWV